MHRRRFISGAAAIALASGCAKAAPERQAAPSGVEPSTIKPVTTPVVLVVSFDGLNPDAIAELGSQRVPGLTRLRTEGASTMNARTAHEITVTLPNHTGMLTGRRLAGEGGTSVTFNDDSGGTLAASHGSYVPGIFDVAHDHGLSTGFFAEKTKFRYLIRSWDEDNGATDSTGTDDGRDKIDTDAIDVSDLVPDVKQAIADGASLVFWHQAAPDAAGHRHGWMGPEYLEAVRTADTQLQSLLTWLDQNPAVRDRLTIIATADHGGPKGKRSHDVPDDPANYTIPFLAWGRGVSPGDLYALNPERRDPGRGRPNYDGPQPIRNIDVADLALESLGLPSGLGLEASKLRVSQAV